MITIESAIIFGLLGGVLRVIIGYSKIYGIAGHHVPFQWKRASISILVALFVGALTPLLIESDSPAIALLAGFAGSDLLEALAKGLMKLKTGFTTGFGRTHYSEILGEGYKSDLLNKRYEKAIKHIEKTGKITNNQYEKINRVSHNTATRDLNKMKSLGLIKKVGSGRNAHYKQK